MEIMETTDKNNPKIDVRDSSAVAIADNHSIALINMLTEEKFVIPFQLPAKPKIFLGRNGVQNDILQKLREREGILIGVYGMGGIGKTTLAISVAYEIKDNFPDGVLWVRLDKSPLYDCLDTIAKSCGYDIQQLKGIENKASFVRTLFSKNQMLVILDNAISIEDLELLIVSSGKSSTIVTSRNDEILNFTKAENIKLKKLSIDDSVELFFTVSEVRNGEKEVVSKICTLLDGLPLAILISAKTVKNYFIPLEDYSNLLRNSKTILSELQYQNLSVRSSFEISWNHMTEQEKFVFAVIGIFNSNVITLEALAYILQKQLIDLRRIIGRLSNISLLEKQSNNSFSLHPLLKEFANEKLQQLGNASTVRKMHSEWFLIYTQANSRKYKQLTEFFEDIKAGMEEVEREQDWIRFTKYLEAISFFLVSHYDVNVFYQMSKKAIEANKLEDHIEELSYLYSAIGYVERIKGNYDVSISWFTKAIETARRGNVPHKEAMYLHEKGAVLSEKGDIESARFSLNEGVEIATKLNDELRIAKIYNEIGNIDLKQGLFSQGIEKLRTSIKIKHEQEDYAGEAYSLLTLARHFYDQGKFEQSLEILIEAREIQKKKTDTRRIGQTYLLLAKVYFALSDYVNAKKVIHLASRSASQVADINLLNQTQEFLLQLNKEEKTHPVI